MDFKIFYSSMVIIYFFLRSLLMPIIILRMVPRDYRSLVKTNQGAALIMLESLFWPIMFPVRVISLINSWQLWRRYIARCQGGGK